MLNFSLDRLRKTADFRNVAQRGERSVTRAFILQAYQHPHPTPSRYGLIASRKVGGAVERNRAKRRLRALLRDVLPHVALPGIDYVIIARKDVLTLKFTQMEEDLKTALSKVHKRLP